MLKFFLCAYFFLSPAAAASCTDCEAGDLSLINNRYDGVVIAINPEIPENPEIINQLKIIWTKASDVLWNATNHTAYFGDVTILVPKQWKLGQYESAGSETYDNAHVVVANPNPSHGNAPYTLQYGECGTMGEYIHLTPHFVLNSDVILDYGPKEKVIVHEWAHFRWGVYDESPTPGYDPFYFDEQQEVQATRSPVSLKGLNVIQDPKTGKIRSCDLDGKTNWLPEDGCMFIPFKKQNPKLKTSLLSHPYLEQVVTFCHDDENDSINMNNYEARNEHNRLCDQRSAWSVMKDSDDFNGSNPSRPNLNRPPINFKVVQPKIPRFVLVLDTSGSMSGEPYELMMTAAHMLVSEFVPDGSAVGIVEFSSSANIESYLVSIQGKSDRDHLENELDKVKDATGGTCIGCGIERAIEVLEHSSYGVSGAHIIVLTDGVENGAPYVRDTVDEVCSKRAVMDTIFFGSNADSSDLFKLVGNTCGLFFTTGIDDLQGLIESFKSLSETNDGDVNSKVFQIYGESLHVPANSYESGFVNLDSTIGKDTVFTITWSQYSYEPNVRITDPSGNKFCSLPNPSICPENIVTIENEIKTMKFVLPGIAENGRWIYEIFPSSHSQEINIMVTTKAANETVPPVMVKSTISTTEASTGQAIVVNAMVTQGYLPIIGATVIAEIKPVNGFSPSYLELYDGGSAPDVRKNDGIYSRYFTGYTTAGKYSVKVKVEGKVNSTSFMIPGSPAPFNFGYVADNGTVILNPNAAGHPNNNQDSGVSAKDIDPFSRIEQAGGFSFSGSPNTPSSDSYPPSQVIDLKAKQIDGLDATQGIELTFTAPGDNYDEGVAKFYEIRFTYDKPTILTNSFTNAIEVTSKNLLDGDLNMPSVANSIEVFQVNLTQIPKDKDLISVAFALRATDDAGNTGYVSNIAMMNLFLKPPATACTDENGKPISGDPFEKPQDCLNFYQCSNGKLYTISCKNETVFNPKIGTCDQPINVPYCYNAIDVIPPTPEAAKPSCIDGNGQAETTAPFAKENDCTHFYQCSNGQLFEFTCPPGLVFNPQALYCDWPQNVDGC